MPTMEEVLIERGERYGKFSSHAEITQKLKLTMFEGIHMDPKTTERVKSRVAKMHHDQKECLEMIAHKIGRILNGDPNYGDSWRDIAGYATLVADRLEGVVEKSVVKPISGPTTNNSEAWALSDYDKRCPDFSMT